MHLSELRGRRVVSRASAETMGEVNDLLLQPHPWTVSALVLGKGRKAQTVDWPQIVGIGPDAVVVSSDDLPAEAKDARSPIGRLALGELGNAAGAVTDVEFDETSGALISLTTEAARIEGDRLIVDGPYALIVAARDGGDFLG